MRKIFFDSAEKFTTHEFLGIVVDSFTRMSAIQTIGFIANLNGNSQTTRNKALRLILNIGEKASLPAARLYNATSVLAVASDKNILAQAFSLFDKEFDYPDTHPFQTTGNANRLLPSAEEAVKHLEKAPAMNEGLGDWVNSYKTTVANLAFLENPFRPIEPSAVTSASRNTPSDLSGLPRDYDVAAKEILLNLKIVSRFTPILAARASIAALEKIGGDHRQAAAKAVVKYIDPLSEKPLRIVEHASVKLLLLAEPDSMPRKWAFAYMHLATAQNLNLGRHFPDAFANLVNKAASLAPEGTLVKRQAVAALASLTKS